MSEVKDFIYEFTLANNFISIVKYIGDEKDVVVPNMIDGNIVHGIRPFAFANCKFESIKLPKSINKIEEGAFYNCVNLKEFVGNSELKDIGRYSFAGCTNLKRCQFPSSISIIREGMFKDCYNLEYFDSLDYITEIENYAFSGCVNFNFKIIPIRNKYLKKIGIEAFKNCHKLVYLLLPDCTRYIGSGAFENCINLYKVSLSKEISIIDKYTFKDCINLVSVDFPQGVKILRKNSFMNCYHLTDVNFSKKPIMIESNTFSCNIVPSITINYVTHITDFNNNSNYIF